MMPDEFFWKLLRRATLSICRRCWSVCQDWYVWILNLHNLFCRPNCVLNSQRVLCNITASFTLALLFLGHVPWSHWAACAGKLENVCTLYTWTLWFTIFPETGQFLGTSGVESVPSAWKIFVLESPLTFLSSNFTSDSNTISNTGENKRDMSEWRCRLHFVTTEADFDVCLLPQR